VLAAEDAKGVPYDDAHIAVVKTSVYAGVDRAAGRGWDASSGDAGRREGCRVVGTVTMRRAAGVVYVAAPRTLTNVDGRLMFTIAPDTMTSFNASHTITRLSFGPAFPGQVSPLDGAASPPTATAGSWQYHLRVVPTTYTYLYGTAVASAQFSAADFVQTYDAEAGGAGMVHPGVWWRVDWAPLTVSLSEARRSFLSFAVSLCGLLGGVFAISGVVDTLLHRAVESRKAK
jgi:endoplasmic reticulum-Golgi intermediate compartment protein 3